MIPAPATLPLPQSTSVLHNFQGESCGGQATLIQALTISCNTAFGGLGLTLGQDALRTQADAFGFDSPYSVPMKSATSVFPVDLSDANTIQSAIGQFDVRATPLQMAMVAAAIANGGVEMKPYLVDQLVGPDLRIVDQTKPTQLRRAVSPQVAAELTQMMESVVQHGTGTSCTDPGGRGRRQDGHRPERDRSRSSRVVRRVRTRRPAQDRHCRSRRERRRQQRRDGRRDRRAHRQGSHPGRIEEEMMRPDLTRSYRCAGFNQVAPAPGSTGPNAPNIQRGFSHD